MGVIVEEYAEWNTPVVGAYLLWRFAQGYVSSGERHENPPLPLFCIVTVLLRGRAYSEAIEHVRSLHGYAARLVKYSKADKLKGLHDRIIPMMPYTLQAIDIAVSRRLLEWDVENAALAPKKIKEFKRGTKSLSKSVQKLGDKADKLGNWMSGLTLSDIALDLGVRF